MLDDSGSYTLNSSLYNQCTQFDCNSGDEMSIIKDEYQFDQQNDSMPYKSHTKSSSIIEQQNTYFNASTDSNCTNNSIKHHQLRVSPPVVITRLTTSPTHPTSQLLPSISVPQVQQQQPIQLPSPIQPQTSQTSRQSSYIVSNIAIKTCCGIH